MRETYSKHMFIALQDMRKEQENNVYSMRCGLRPTIVQLIIVS